MENYNNFYARSFFYENFMKRAFRSERNCSKGIDNSIYRQLFEIESGSALSNKNYSKQIQKIKNYLEKGIIKVLTWRLTLEERIQVQQYLAVIHRSKDEYDLYHAIQGLLVITQRFIAK